MAKDCGHEPADSATATLRRQWLAALLVLAGMVAFVVVTYAVVVLGGGALLGQGSADVGLSIVATAVVGLGFDPVQSRLDHDPSVPYEWAFGLAAQIRGSGVLSRVGDGHTSYCTSDCTRRATEHFLLTMQSSVAPVCAK